MPQSHSGRKVKNFLIQREFQLRWAGYMVAVASILTAGLGWLVFHFNREASRVVDVRAMDPTDAEAQALAEAFHRSEWQLLAGLVAFGVLLALVLFVWQIVSTHRIAGPLYYIQYQTRRIKDGFLGKLRPLREHDLLHGFFESFREMHEAMRKRAGDEAAQFGRMADEAEAAGHAKIAEELRALKRQREESLG